MTKIVTLTKALKLKNNIVRKIDSIKQEIEIGNSIETYSEGMLQDLIADLDKAHRDLAELKSIIQIANAPINLKIFRIGEIRSQIEFLRSLMPTLTFKYEKVDSVLTARNLVDWITLLEDEGDNIQDEINEFNHETRVKIEG